MHMNTEFAIHGYDIMDVANNLYLISEQFV